MSTLYEGVLVSGLTTTDPFADTFRVRVYSDSARTQLVTSDDSPIVSGSQSQSIIFQNLILGNYYYLAATTLVSSSGIESTPPLYFNLQAGELTTPSTTYTFVAYSSTAGFYITVTPVGPPSNLDHYEYYVTSAPVPSGTPTFSPTASVYPDANGTFSFMAPGVSGSSGTSIFVRSVTTQGVAQAWVSLTNQTVPLETSFTVVSAGTANASLGATGVWINGVHYAWTNDNGDPGDGHAASGLNLICVNRNTLAVGFSRAYSSTETIANLLADLPVIASTQPDVLYIFWVKGDISITRNAALLSVMYGLGASSNYLGASNFQPGAAYICVGQAGLGQGNGIELYTGAVTNDVNAYCETSFFMLNGNVIGYNGGAGQTDSTQGGLSPYGNVPPNIAQSMTYASARTQIAWTYNVTVFRGDTNETVQTYTGTYTETGLTPGTTYYFFPFVVEDITDPNYGQVLWVNSSMTSGGFGANGSAFTSLTYAAAQGSIRMDRLALGSPSVTASTVSTGTGGGSSGGSGACLHEDTWQYVVGKGFTRLADCRIGDEVYSPSGITPIVDLVFEENEVWMGLTVCYQRYAEGYFTETLFCTPNHRFAIRKEDGSFKLVRAAELKAEDRLWSEYYEAVIKEVSLSTFVGRKARLSVGANDGLFLAGRGMLLNHNAFPILGC